MKLINWSPVRTSAAETDMPQCYQNGMQKDTKF
jgi:hypothetical protein